MGPVRACERAERERAENQVSGSGAVSGHSRKRLNRSGAWSSRQRSGERARSAAQSSLKSNIWL